MAKPFLVLAAATGLLIATLPTAASAVAGTAQTTRAADEQPPLVEDYSYPGADKILAEQGFKLITGDGHMLLADCPSTPGNDGFIRVRRNLKPIACFKVPAGQSGRLTMEIPEVTFVKGDDHTVKATLAGQSTAIDISKNEWTPIPGDKGSTLVTLVATP
ncbi:hypothetical protein [Amycolatopsis vastitatis]|uniref:Secreted protein n=1 Tax=Amycolatopsis vastitatis TaxID=1905142 RepID=A0A229SNL6_9PSEU|nr:hypothetical protein [Amycolatopsis vastitatis]OXM60440.1 hypothetical protein CF165_42675 [Amycolatopsis vastitatis]